jgi:hypothetical protein
MQHLDNPCEVEVFLSKDLLLHGVSPEDNTDARRRFADPHLGPSARGRATGPGAGAGVTPDLTIFPSCRDLVKGRGH